MTDITFESFIFGKFDRFERNDTGRNINLQIINGISNDEIDKIKEVLFEFGQLEKIFYFFVEINSKFCIAVLNNEDIKILLLPSNVGINPLNLADALNNYQNFDSAIKKFQLSIPNSKTIDPSFLGLNKWKNLEKLIFSLLVKDDIAFVGTHEEVSSILCLIFEILPVGEQANYSFCTQSSSIFQREKLFGIYPSERNQSEILENEKRIFKCVLDFSAKNCKGYASTRDTKKITDYLVVNDLENAREVINYLFTSSDKLKDVLGKNYQSMSSIQENIIIEILHTHYGLTIQKDTAYLLAKMLGITITNQFDLLS